MKLLIDGDVLTYKAGFAAEDRVYRVLHKESQDILAEFGYKKEVDEFLTMYENPDEVEVVKVQLPQPVQNAFANVKNILLAMREATDATDYQIYLTGDGNFREGIATIKPYKGNRDRSSRPIHFNSIRHYMVEEWDAEVIPYQEADDAMGIEQYLEYQSTLIDNAFGNPVDYGTCICTIDKDLDMIPGYHYNFDTGKQYFITEDEGIRFFYTQLITGDTVDNIQGVPKCGPAKARKVLKECESEEEMYWAVLALYCEAYDKPMEALIENARLLWIRREPNQMWEPPV